MNGFGKARTRKEKINGFITFKQYKYYKPTKK